MVRNRVLGYFSPIRRRFSIFLSNVSGTGREVNTQKPYFTGQEELYFKGWNKERPYEKESRPGREIHRRFRPGSDSGRGRLHARLGGEELSSQPAAAVLREVQRDLRAAVHAAVDADSPAVFFHYAPDEGQAEPDAVRGG